MKYRNPSYSSYEIFIDVSDIKQFFFCPRIIYYMHVLGFRERTTESEISGREAHEDIIKREKRRKSLAAKRIFTGYRKHFGVKMVSKKLLLKGRLDMLVENGKNYIPVEYKSIPLKRKKPPANHKYQLIAYGLLVDETYDTYTKLGYIYYSVNDRLVPVYFTRNSKEYVKETTKHIREIILNEEIPRGYSSPSKCKNCGYHIFCLQA
ncbi:CRISPR-associated protein Cas4 [Candidatus Woesearchaeota archaeon]|nr:CRISPR-associated protein Cas4 [Thermoproteales archaeon]RLE38699.1 MAG: CRISPR-associated protein Cas4 [Candidatus Woesearchaeota archaeon]